MEENFAFVYPDQPVKPVRKKAKTLAIRKISKAKLREWAKQIEFVEYTRPSNRCECRNGIRPCPFISCKYNLYLDVNPKTGSIKFNFPHLDPSEMPESCALDIADRGGITLEDVGDIMNLTRERVRQLEASGLKTLNEHFSGN